MNNLRANIENDIWTWIKEYVEVNHEFYGYKFPPCPYAKAARLKGSIDVIAYEDGSVKQFIKLNVQDLLDAKDKKITQRALILPPRAQWTLGIKKFIHNLNTKIVSQDYYIQFGRAIKTQSRYAGLFNSGAYCIILINLLSEVMEGHQALLSTDYYKPWSQEHYDAVVVRRQDMYDKFGNLQNEENNSNL